MGLARIAERSHVQAAMTTKFTKCSPHRAMDIKTKLRKTFLFDQRTHFIHIMFTYGTTVVKRIGSALRSTGTSLILFGSVPKISFL